METTDLLYLKDLKPGMTFFNKQKNERWRLIRCPETGERITGVNGPLLNDRRHLWMVAPVEDPKNELLWCFDEVMQRSELQLKDPE